MPRGKTHELGMLNREEMCIFVWKKKGISLKEIAQRLTRHRLSINRLVARAKHCGKFVMPPLKKGSGAVRKIYKSMTGILKRQVLKYPMMTATKLLTSLAKLWVVSKRKIRNTLQKRLNMPRYVVVMNASGGEIRLKE
jgi:hypothetical protein